jgi:hypothetical protein
VEQYGLIHVKMLSEVDFRLAVSEPGILRNYATNEFQYAGVPAGVAA